MHHVGHVNEIDIEFFECRRGAVVHGRCKVVPVSTVDGDPELEDLELGEMTDRGGQSFDICVIVDLPELQLELLNKRAPVQDPGQ